MQDQLFNAGPVRIVGRISHKKGRSQPQPRPCREPGCTKQARPVQGATYCEVHARAVDYKANGLNVEMALKVATTCLGCGGPYRRLRMRARYQARDAWDSFCPRCTDASPLSLDRLRAHNVSFDQTVAWLNQGNDLACDFCGHLLDRRTVHRKPCIDHDHSCCEGQRSCGSCIRGILCVRCNTGIGVIETLSQVRSLDEVVVYIKRNR